MIYISFRDFPEDVFADSEIFQTKDEASLWFNPQYHKWKEEGKSVKTLKEWPVSEEVDYPLYDGTFLKGYKVEDKGKTILWILITIEEI